MSRLKCCSFLLTMFLWATCSIDLPNCHTSDFLKVLPLVPEEAYIINLNNLFTGYNLRYNATVDPDIQKYVNLGDKIKQLNNSYPDVPLSGLKNYHLSNIGNSWGPLFIALTEKGDRSLVHYGILSDNVSVPVINNYITVQNFTNTTCFDAVQVADNNLIVVDCAQKRASNNSRGQLYDNIFYYFRISDGVKVKQLKTEMYAPFQQQSRRKLQLYYNIHSSHNLLFRTYFFDELSIPAKDNTYLQILMMQDPLNPWTLGVVDRTFLGVQRLWITDVKIYLEQIYILDQMKGVHRIRIKGYEQLVYEGLYEAKGFNRMAVFSPNLDNHIELAISNTHAIHQIDWTDLNEPFLINKYSVLPDSKISQVFMNDRFIFVRSSALDSGSWYNYTWTFTRGDRTFSRAFAVISHSSDATFVDFNSQLSYLMIISSQELQNYAYDDPSFVLQLDQNEDLFNKVRSFKLTASSQDPNGSGTKQSCELILNFTLLQQNNRTMWAVGGAPPSNFTSNYPGIVKIQLSEYILGPNVTYRIRQTQKGQLKKAKVFQSQQLSVVWEDSAPSLTDSIFLQTETFQGSPNDTLVLYIQDALNKTHTIVCKPNHQLLQVRCKLNLTRDLGGKITNWATSMVQQPYSQNMHHILAFTTGSVYNQIFIQDLTTGKEIDEIYLGSGFPGNVSSVTITGKYMYAVLRHIKRVNIYSLQDCLDGYCDQICYLGHLNMYKLGIKYFAPRLVHSSRFHPNILFVKTDQKIIAIDLSKQCVPKLLAQIKPVTNAQTSFVFQVNADYLIVTITPNIVLQYDISRIYLKQVKMTKKYPLYGYKLPRDYDFDISDYGNCVYISTVNEAGSYNVFVYRSGLPAVGSLYNQIDIVAFQNVLIDASGYRVDYVSVVSSKQIKIFRQYQKPQIQIVNPDEDYQFYLQYQNSVDSASLQLVDVFIINLPTKIEVNPILNDIMNTKNLFYSGKDKLSQVDDSDWYQGNVLYIQSTCRDCPDKIRVNNHIQKEGVIHLIPNLTSYSYSQKGGQILAERSLISLKHNGSIDQIVQFDANLKRKCIQIEVENKTTVVGCTQDGKVFMQVVSWVADKPFPFDQQQTSAKTITRLQITKQLVMLVDAQPQTYGKKRKGGIFLFEISQSLQSDQILSQIQYIDGDDFGMRELGPIYIKNAQLIYDSQRKIYFLYVSESSRGLLILQFTHSFGAPDITIRRTYLVQLKPMIQQINQTLPYDATFQAITLKDAPKNIQNGMTIHHLLITTARYHTLQVTIMFDQASTLKSAVLQRLYLRYSYYEVSNHIKHIDDLFIIEQTLPAQYENQTMNKQLYTIYSTQGSFNGTVISRGLIGALPLSENTLHRFDFNKSIDSSDQHSVPRTGVTVIEEGGNVVQASLHRNLSLYTTELLDTQIIYLDLINDFSHEKIRILLNGLAPFPEWKLITIIIFSILGAILLGATGFVVVKKIREGRPIGQQRQTLVTDQAFEQ